ncbi:MAG: PAS domain S-box protein [Verrucomicrobia bacterium]|nr:PAS domain S-box protein [Verrucomicrobiota bacterium]
MNRLPSREGRLASLVERLSDRAGAGYAVAILGTALAALVRWGLGKMVGEGVPPYITFYPAIILAALVGGSRPGLLATLLSSVTVTVLFLWPFNAADITGLAFFTGINVAMAFIGSAVRQERQAVRESRARLAGVLDSAMDPVISVDESQRVVFFNPAAAQTFRCPSAEAIGQPLDRFIPERFRTAHRQHIRRFGEEGDTSRKMGALGELAALRSGGEEFPIEASISRVEVGGQTIFTVILRDITARKQAEAERELHTQRVQRANDALLASQRQLQAANRELNDFAAIVSHDLKAPLRSVATLANWLQSDYADKLDGEGQEHLTDLNRRVMRMDRMIEGILHYSRLGRTEEKPEPAALGEIVRSVVEDLSPPAHVRVRVAPDLPVVAGEPVRLRQLFQNLIANAIKHADKPQVDIAVTWADAGAFWQFSVADNGPGIEARHFERIFKIFQTLAPKDRTDSTGVGLALVQRIVELAGGRVWVESRVGAGSTFHFTWPKTRAVGASQ